MISAYQIPPYTKPSEHLLVFGENVFGDQPCKGRAVEPAAKKRGAWVPDSPSGFESCDASDENGRIDHAPTMIFSIRQQ